MQTLTAEEQSADMVGHLPVAAEAVHHGPDEADDDVFAADDNEALDGGSDIELDA